MGTYVHNDLCLTPAMTSNTAPSPNVVSAIYEAGDPYRAWKAFDQAGDTEWISGFGSGEAPWWLKFDFGVGNTGKAASYTVSASENSDHDTRAPKTWTLQGSNNDADWDVLDTQTDVPAWTLGEMREYSIAVPASYRYYKLNITVGYSSGVNSYLVIGEVELLKTNYIESDITNPSLQAQGFTGIYSAPSISMTQAEGFMGITAEPSISMMRGQATLSDDIIHIESFVTIPSISVSLTQAEQIWGAATIPSMMAEITERGTTLADVSIPMMTAELASGVHADLEVTVPIMTAEGLFSNQCEITVPMMTIEMEGQVGRVISSAVSIPKMTVEITGKTEHLVDGTVSVPMVRVRADFMTGKIITGTIILPAMEAALTSYEDIDGDINVSIPAMVAFLKGTTERSACPVLRYDDKPDILGSMAAEIPMAEASLTEL